MDIVLRNFFRLLRSGAFSINEPLEPMSFFKWRRLYQMIEVQNVADVFACGIAHHLKEEGINISNDILRLVSVDSVYHPSFKELTLREVSMSTGVLTQRFYKILNGEYHSIDTSVETIDLLKLLIVNEQDFLYHGINMKGIILLGCYLREKGEFVDFVKLDAWLNRLFLRRIAQLQGSILISVFGFETEELPFVYRKELEAFKLVEYSVRNLAKDTAQEWHFRQTRTGFVSNNSTMLFRSIRRSIRYLPYAPIETISSFFKSLLKGLKEIEE